MIEITCMKCDESVKTRDVQKAVAFDREHTALHAPPGSSWIDKQGDIWRLGDDGLMHTPETAPFSREHVEKKWGPLRLVKDPTGA